MISFPTLFVGLGNGTSGPAHVQRHDSLRQSCADRLTFLSSSKRFCSPAEVRKTVQWYVGLLFGTFLAVGRDVRCVVIPRVTDIMDWVKAVPSFLGAS